MAEPFAENQKHQRAAKPVCSVNTVKNASFTWNDLTVIETQQMHYLLNIRFSFDLLVSEDLDNASLKLCELIIPSVHF